jgi:hypothetical protein
MADGGIAGKEVDASVTVGAMGGPASLDAAFDRYQEVATEFRKWSDKHTPGSDNRALDAKHLDLTAAAMGLMTSGLHHWLEAAAKDRASAEEDRKAAREAREAARKTADAELIKQERDRDQQRDDRAAMNRFTKAIMFAAIVSAVATGLSAIAMIVGVFRTPTPLVIPAPIVAPAAAPTVNVAPVPITLSPVINVTLPSRPPRSRSAP